MYALVLEYLFALVKAKDRKTKTCFEKLPEKIQKEIAIKDNLE